MTARKEGDHWFLSDNTELKAIRPWKTPDSWWGKSWDGWFVALGQTRDSDTVSESNFRVLQAMLDELPVIEVDDSGNQHGGYWDKRIDALVDGVQVVRESHWACGWIEWIAIHETNEAALRVADDALCAIEGYPILDEDDWSQLEFDQINKFWSEMHARERIHYCVESGESIFAARRDYPPERVFDRMRDTWQ